MAASSATAPWAGMVSRRRKRRYSRGTCATGCRSTARSTLRAGCWGWGSKRGNLRMEARFDGALVDRLLSAGHDVGMLAEPYSDGMGHAGAVVLHPDGTCEGSHDPRADGGAAGV